MILNAKGLFSVLYSHKTVKHAVDKLIVRKM